MNKAYRCKMSLRKIPDERKTRHGAFCAHRYILKQPIKKSLKSVGISINRLSFFLFCLDLGIAQAVESDSTRINPFRKHEIGIQYNPVFFDNINAFEPGYHHTIYSLKYGNNFKKWLYLGIEINYISKKTSFYNYIDKSYTIVPELYSKFNLLSNKNKTCIFFTEANLGYYYRKGSGYMSAIVNTYPNPCPCFYEYTRKTIIYFITPGIRLYIFPDELDKRLSLDLMCKLSAKKDFLVNYNYYVPSFKINYHFSKIKFGTKWLKNILD